MQRVDDAKPQGKVTYADHVRPILREHCFTCHNQNKATNDLALDSYERILKGGASGEAIKPGSLDDSYLWQLVSHQQEPSMPPKQDKLPEAKLQVIKQWILGGALKEAGSKARGRRQAEGRSEHVGRRRADRRVRRSFPPGWASSR